MILLLVLLLLFVLLLVLLSILVFVLRPSLLRDAGDAEVPFDGRQLVYVDVADEVHDGQLLRLGGDDEQAVWRVTAHVEVDLGVLPIAALDLHNPLPRGPELGAQAVHDAAVVLPFLVEFVGADVDALEAFDDLASLAVVAVVEELRGQPEHGAVERDVGRFRGAVAEAGDVDVESLLRVKRRGGEEDQTSENQPFAHDVSPSFVRSFFSTFPELLSIATPGRESARARRGSWRR